MVAIGLHSNSYENEAGQLGMSENEALGYFDSSREEEAAEIQANKRYWVDISGNHCQEVSKLSDNTDVSGE